MKTRLPPLLSVLLPAFLLFTGCASSADGVRGPAYTLQSSKPLELALPFPPDDPVGLLPGNFSISDRITDLDRRAVLQRFGRPAERLTPDLWIYWGFHAPREAAGNGGHDTLVVSFVRGRVNAMKLVPGDVLRAHLAGAWRPGSALAGK